MRRIDLLALLQRAVPCCKLTAGHAWRPWEGAPSVGTLGGCNRHAGRQAGGGDVVVQEGLRGHMPWSRATLRQVR